MAPGVNAKLDFGTIICSIGARYKVRHRLKVDKPRVHIVFPPEFRALALSSAHAWSSGGANFLFQQYSSDCARTLFIEPTKEQEEVYNLAVEVQTQIINGMTPGVVLSSLYNKAKDFIADKKPDLANKLLGSCGTAVRFLSLHRPLFDTCFEEGLSLVRFGRSKQCTFRFFFSCFWVLMDFCQIGLEFSDPLYSISAGNKKKLQDGMTFNVRVGFHNVDDSVKGRYSVLLGDTVLVTASGAEVLTDKATKKYVDVSYDIEKKMDEDSVEEKPRKSSDKKDSAKPTSKYVFQLTGPNLQGASCFVIGRASCHIFRFLGVNVT